MNSSDIASIRLTTQHIAGTTHNKIKDLAAWMGAMQAQDYGSSKWGLGARLSTSTDSQIEEALDKGDIIRTHVLRPTWHLVSAENIYWMQELTAPHVKKIVQARFKELELTEAIIKKSQSIIENALTGGKHLTRDELIAILNKRKIETDNLRAAHIMMHAELDNLICSGARKGKQQTYGLLNERVKKTQSLSREEGLKKLAHRYFSSHGPATMQDFVWWSGLPVKDARKSIEMIQSDFVVEKVGTEIFLCPNTSSKFEKNENTLYLLPAFDEYIISYKDRSASLPSEHNKKVVSNNGIFRPVIVHNGQVIGMWNREMKKDKAIITASAFKGFDKKTKTLIEKAAESYGNFLERKVEVIFELLK